MISVVVPVYNEEKVLPSFISTFFREINLKENFELIFVNDGSTDKTKEIIWKFMELHSQIKLVSYMPNKNLGFALPLGFRVAKGRIIVTMDADLAHPPRFISKLVENMNHGYDVVIGSRYLPDAGVEGVPFSSNFLSKLTNSVTKLIIWSQLKDVTSGFRAFKAEKLKKLRFKEVGFEVELEILVKFLKRNARIVEVPFISTDREKGESKFSLVKHGPRYIAGMLRIFWYRWF